MNRRREIMTAVLCVTFIAAGVSAQTIAPGNTPAGRPGLQPSSLQNPTLGSVPTGTASPQAVPLSLADAIVRGLRQHLGLLLSSDAQLSAQGQFWQARSPLLPNLSAGVKEEAQKVNLAAEGFGKIAGQFPGFPLIVGPFGYFDARAVFTQSLIDFNLLASARSSRQNAAAARLNYQDMREAIVLVVGATYLQCIAAAARVDTADAQVQSAQALYNQAVDMRTVGVSAGIDVLRAQVELQSRRQQLISSRNDF